MSLRLRLLLAITGFVLAGLLVAGGATYVSLRSFLVKRVDQQAAAAQGMFKGQLTSGSQPPESFPDPDRGPGDVLPPGTVGEIVSGTTVVAGPLGSGFDQTAPHLKLPEGTGDITHPARFTTTNQEGTTPYRVLAQPLGAGQGVLVVGIPLTEVHQTLSRLLLIEGLVALAVMLGLGFLSWWTVRRELRPLDHIEETAGAIAGGDLSQRVDATDPRTEVGRLGIALNAMLAQIEEAFAERTESENRLRRFLADASHELRTPLTSIRGYSELFRRGAEERPEDLATSMRRIEQEATRMGVLVDELLLLARLDQGRPLERAPVDLVAIATDAVSDASAVDPTRRIVLSAPDRAVVSGDESRLRQVVANLMTNALGHTPPASPIEVTVDRGPSDAVLAVRDHGRGLSEEERAHVFEPFYRSDPSRQRERGGTGLGLAIVSAIVEAHGGTVHVDSEPGAGARFRVEIPLAPEPASQLTLS